MSIKEQLNDLLKNQHEAVNDWFDEQYQSRQPVFYSSVDLRHSGSKLAPVDTNLFPAGFNNLNEKSFGRAVESTTHYLHRYYPDAKTVMLIAENHTRNLMYLDNIAILSNMIESAGYKIILSNAEEGIDTMRTLESASGQQLHYHPLIKKNNKLMTVDGIVPDLVINNNDLSNGVPTLLEGIEQPLIPDIRLGWYKRRKSGHFGFYDQASRQFGERFSVDPFLISTIFHQCGMVHFKERAGIECVALGVEKVMTQLRQKYAEYGIKDEPYVFVKADNGTYGMGIMTARSGEDVVEMNKKSRNKMDVIKGGVENTEVIIQEGIQTIDRIDGDVAEPMIYMVGGKPVGCIFRVHNERDAFGNLNAQGMRFEKNICQDSQENTPCSFGAFGIVARLASLAAAREE